MALISGDVSAETRCPDRQSSGTLQSLKMYPVEVASEWQLSAAEAHKGNVARRKSTFIVGLRRLRSSTVFPTTTPV